MSTMPLNFQKCELEKKKKKKNKKSVLIKGCLGHFTIAAAATTKKLTEQLYENQEVTSAGIDMEELEACALLVWGKSQRQKQSSWHL